MHKLTRLVLAILCLAAITPSAHAAKTIKAATPAKAVKETLVLMPLRVPDEDKSLQGSMETALVQGMQQKYVVFSGEQVAQKAKAIFLKESRNTSKKECDETKCMQDIAIAFQAELIATANVTKRPDGYFLALSIQNIFDNKVVYSNSLACKRCDAYQVVEKLKELSGITDTASAPAATTAAPGGNATEAETNFWVAAQKGNTLSDYQLYMDTYPQGKYLAFAHARVNKMKDEAEREAELKELKEQEEAELWNRAENRDDKIATEAYLRRYPSGRHIAAANAKLEQIKEKEEDAKAPPMVRIPGTNYQIGKYEVTQKEWRDVMGSNPSEASNCGDTCPVENVSWDDVQTFLQRLNVKTGRQYRLPTEAEWEYACYGGNQTEYCGSNDINSVAWYTDNSNKTTHPVGQKQANGYGLYDMSGNVWEWQGGCFDGNCADSRLIRGGSWVNRSKNVRAVIRFSFRASDRSGHLGSFGFRLARTLP